MLPPAWLDWKESPYMMEISYFDKVEFGTQIDQYARETGYTNLWSIKCVLGKVSDINRYHKNAPPPSLGTA